MVIIGALVCIDVTKVIQVENKLGKRTDRLNIFLTNIDKETIKDSKIWFMALLRCKAHSYRLREGTEPNFEPDSINWTHFLNPKVQENHN